MDDHRMRRKSRRWQYGIAGFALGLLVAGTIGGTAGVVVEVYQDSGCGPEQDRSAAAAPGPRWVQPRDWDIWRAPHSTVPEPPSILLMGGAIGLLAVARGLK